MKHSYLPWLVCFSAANITISAGICYHSGWLIITGALLLVVALYQLYITEQSKERRRRTSAHDFDRIVKSITDHCAMDEVRRGIIEDKLAVLLKAQKKIVRPGKRQSDEYIAMIESEDKAS